MEVYGLSQDHYVSIIIPVLNEERVIGECLSAICRLNTPKEKYEVILVDNGCTDDTLKIANKFNVRIIQGSEQLKETVSAARNLGVKYSRGDILAFVDADCIVTDNWLKNALYCLEEYAACAVGHKYNLPKNSRCVEKAWDSLFKEQERKGEVDWLPAGNFIILRNCFESVGGFDESLITNEDCDLCYRLRKRGYVILSDPTISVIHLGTPQKYYEIFKKELWHGKGAFQIFLKDFCSVRNMRPVIFAIFYLICYVGISINLVLYILSQHFIAFLLLLTFSMASIIVPVILAIRNLASKMNYRLLGALTVVYFIYGTARAFCLIRLIKNREFKK
jgi:cellulose synthase/poly-beta-1,6-N-acetylglucosamine synthase-like glycosyltransferase